MIKIADWICAVLLYIAGWVGSFVGWALLPIAVVIVFPFYLATKFVRDWLSWRDKREALESEAK